MPQIMMLNAGPVFARAKAAYERTSNAPNERASGQMDALDAIVFAAAALEAFLNEAVEFASEDFSPNQNPDSVRSFADLVDEVEQSHASLRLKLSLASAVFTGKTYDKAVRPYQDFELLMELRNAIMHVKPREKMIADPRGWWRMETPRIVQRLRSRNITAEYDDRTDAAMILHISTRATARWACNTAADMFHSFIDMVPECDFKSQLTRIYGIHFQPLQ